VKEAKEVKKSNARPFLSLLCFLNFLYLAFTQYSSCCHPIFTFCGYNRREDLVP
jgi:hypothetical protein